MKVRRGALLVLCSLAIALILIFSTAPSLVGSIVLLPGSLLANSLINSLSLGTSHLYELSVSLDCILYGAVAIALVRVSRRWTAA